ncbi:hypothetical protein SAMN03159495_2747 [Pseudomonas sp. NFR16]|nr:hypothetical protein SAMN03159495_2747 [Pseudomonas sp. NFR16]
MRFAQPERTTSEHLNPCGSELARDRRRSRRESGLCGLPDAPRHPILLPLRARSRASALLQGICGVAGICVESKTCGSVACPAIGDAVVVNPGYAVCLMRRVIRFCCRCAPDRGQATLLQGIRGGVRFCVESKTCGSVACPAIGDAVVVNPGYAVCLMRRVIRFCCRCAPDRGQATLLQGIRGVVRFCVERTSRGSVACPAIGDAVVVNPGYAVCLMRRVIRFCCRCAPDRIAHAGIPKRVPYASINPLRRLTLRRKASSKTP